MEERYLRNLGALSEAECAMLRDKRVFVAGCGGLGGYILEMLLRLGIGHITAADGDVFEPSNLNRQLLSTVEGLGHAKADTAGARAASVNPQVEFVAVPAFVTADNAANLIRGCDVVLDALDNIASRRLLKAECDRQGIPYIYGAIHGWTAQCAVSLPGDGLLDRLYPATAVVSDKASLAFTPPFCAAMQVALCVKLLCGRKVEPGKLYYTDLDDFEFETLF